MFYTTYNYNNQQIKNFSKKKKISIKFNQFKSKYLTGNNDGMYDVFND